MIPSPSFFVPRIACRISDKCMLRRVARSPRTSRSVHHESSVAKSSEQENIVGTIPSGGQGIEISQYAEIRKTFTADDVMLYGRLIGDMNPIHVRGHVDGNVSSDNKFLKVREEDGEAEAVVHGMLIGSLFSSIFGTLIPGSVYRSQRLIFRAPVFADEPIIGRVDVINIKRLRGRGSLVTCETRVLKPEDETLMKTCVEGEAEIWLPV